MGVVSVKGTSHREPHPLSDIRCAALSLREDATIITKKILKKNIGFLNFRRFPFFGNCSQGAPSPHFPLSPSLSSLGDLTSWDSWNWWRFDPKAPSVLRKNSRRLCRVSFSKVDIFNPLGRRSFVRIQPRVIQTIFNLWRYFLPM